MSETIKLSVPGNPKFVSTIRLAVSSMANHAGFDVEAIEDIKVAVSEACNNIITHGGIGHDEYYVICSIDKGMLEIQVNDEGVGYEVEDYSHPNLDEPGDHGLGLFIIRALMDQVEVQSKVGSGTSIRMKKNITSV